MLLFLILEHLCHFRFQTRRDLVECHQQSVTVTFEDRCPVCERRFTDEAGELDIETRLIGH